MVHSVCIISSTTCIFHHSPAKRIKPTTTATNQCYRTAPKEKIFSSKGAIILIRAVSFPYAMLLILFAIAFCLLLRDFCICDFQAMSSLINKQLVFIILQFLKEKNMIALLRSRSNSKRFIWFIYNLFFIVYCVASSVNRVCSSTWNILRTWCLLGSLMKQRNTSLVLLKFMRTCCQPKPILNLEGRNFLKPWTSN